jgi:hypothetical protein
MSVKTVRGVGLVLLLTGCSSDRVWVTSDLTPNVRVIADGADVRLLISMQEKNDAAKLRWLRGSQPREERVRGVEDRRLHPERYAVTLHPFLDAMAAKPGLSVPGGTKCRLLVVSQARCTPDRLDTFTYVKVQIKGGRCAGRRAGHARASTYFPQRPVSHSSPTFIRAPRTASWSPSRS